MFHDHEGFCIPSGLWCISRDDNVARSPGAGTRASQASLAAALLPAWGPVAPRVPSWVPGGPPTPLPARTPTAINQKYEPEPIPGIRSFAIMKCLLKSHDWKSHPPPRAHFPRVPGAFLADRIIVGRYLRYRGSVAYLGTITLPGLRQPAHAPHKQHRSLPCCPPRGRCPRVPSWGPGGTRSSPGRGAAAASAYRWSLTHHSPPAKITTCAWLPHHARPEADIAATMT